MVAPQQQTKLTDEQIAKYIDAFYRFDTDRDDFINRDELFGLMEYVHLAVDPDRLINLLKDLQINKDRIDKREVLRLVKVLTEKTPDKKDENKGRMINFSAIDLGNKVSAWIDNDAAKPTATSSFFNTRQAAPKPTGAGEVVIEIDNDSSEEESDYEYYSESGGEDEQLISKAKLLPEALKQPSQSAEPSPLPFRSSHPQGSSDERKPLREVSPSPPPAFDRKPVKARGRQLATSASPNKAADSKAKKTPASALADPKVRRQLAKIKEYEPNFLRFITLVQVLVMAFEIVYNGGFESITINPLAGPKALTLIQLGGLYPPCMKADANITADFAQACISGIPVIYKSIDGTCLYSQNMLYRCGMGGFSVGYKPDQLWRLITAQFLHTGVVHFLMNLLIVIRIGFPMERQLGSLRIIVIFLISGVAGSIFAANMGPQNVSAGSSGPLYAYFAMIYLDLANNWPLVRKPWHSFAKVTLGVTIALSIGLLPLIANYDHIGGFLSGICLGLLLMPTVHFSKWDQNRKRLTKLFSLPVLALGMGLGLYSFYYSATNFCPWCQYLDCLPPGAQWCRS